MPNTFEVRHAEARDYQQWLPLWLGYNAFYGRSGNTALLDEITQSTWSRILAPAELVHALVAERDRKIIGITHYLFHLSTTMLGQTCYLQDLFTVERARGQGIGRALISRVYEEAERAGAERVYWHTHESNLTAQSLYNKVADRPGFIMYRKNL
ncbi:MAG: GNAT family N-acetyltransferase [Hyphomicrobiaceae bacterium]